MPERMNLLPLKWRVGLHNALFSRRPPAPRPSGFPPLDEIAAHAARRSDISEHLVSLFVEALMVRPRLIVELGVRGGESTFVFERAVALFGAQLVSVDVQDCSHASSYPGWNFVRSDDLAFAARFPAWCREHALEPEIDLLFVDTSHEREHSRRELEAWLPLVSPSGKAIFHDTNLRVPYWRKDGSWNIGWDNRRGVMAALEDYFDAHFEENEEFVAVHGGWLIRHRPWCAGLTTLQRVPTP